MERRALVSVLVVEDALPVRQAIRAALDTLSGVRVVGEADDAARAIDLVEQLRPDVVTIDVRLRESFGMDVLKAIAAGRPHVRPTTIVLTNHVGPHVRDACLALGADHFLDKALEFGQACEVVSRLVEERRRERHHG